MCDAASNASGSGLSINSQLVLAVPSETFYGTVLKSLGDRRFTILNVASGRIVRSRLKGSLKRNHSVQPGDWVLVSMRDYESDTVHHEQKGEILLRYTPAQVRQLSRAGVLPERTIGPSHALDVVEFVEGSTTSRDFEETQRDMPSEDSDSDQQVAVGLSFMHVEELPSPCGKKSRNRRSQHSIKDQVFLEFRFEPG